METARQNAQTIDSDPTDAPSYAWVRSVGEVEWEALGTFEVVLADGPAVIERLADGYAHGFRRPIVGVLPQSATRDDVIRALRLGAADILIEPVGDVDVRDCLARMMRRRLRPPDVVARSAGPNALAGFLQSVEPLRQLWGALEDQHIGMSDVVALIAQSPGLTIEVLKEANSSCYAASRHTVTLKQAAVRLGARALMVLTNEVLVRPAYDVHPFEDIAEQLWGHSRASAELASILAPDVGVPPQLAHLACLLHNIGKIAILASIAAEYPDGLHRDGDTELLLRLLHEHHTEVGERVLAAMAAPTTFRIIARHHHDIEEAPDLTPEQRALTNLCLLAAETMHANGLGIRRTFEDGRRLLEMCDRCHLKQDRVQHQANVILARMTVARAP